MPGGAQDLEGEDFVVNARAGGLVSGVRAERPRGVRGGSMQVWVGASVFAADPRDATIAAMQKQMEALTAQLAVMQKRMGLRMQSAEVVTGGRAGCELWEVDSDDESVDEEKLRRIRDERGYA